MNERRPQFDAKKVDAQEFEIPETVFARDIDNKVFQGLVLQALSQIQGITLMEGNFIDNLLGRAAAENIKGIEAVQDMHDNTLSIKVEVNVCYGIVIPEKAEEIQTKITEDITKFTGLHVSSVHVVFKNVIPDQGHKKLTKPFTSNLAPSKHAHPHGQYSDEF
jgi:uncharacterized alkaline shock family protein YloU